MDRSWQEGAEGARGARRPKPPSRHARILTSKRTSVQETNLSAFRAFSALCTFPPCPASPRQPPALPAAHVPRDASARTAAHRSTAQPAARVPPPSHPVRDSVITAARPSASSTHRKLKSARRPPFHGSSRRSRWLPSSRSSPRNASAHRRPPDSTRQSTRFHRRSWAKCRPMRSWPVRQISLSSRRGSGLIASSIAS